MRGLAGDESAGPLVRWRGKRTVTRENKSPHPVRRGPPRGEKQLTRGAAVAAVLSGSWRPVPGDYAGPAEALAEAVPCLLETGGGGLAWRRVRDTPLSRSGPGQRLRHAYWSQVVDAPARELETWRTLYVLARDGGPEPVLIKGWASACLYPEPGCRPYGDVDVCVAPDRTGESLRRLTANARFLGTVDLHEGVADLEDRPRAELYRRSRAAAVGPVRARLLGPEDQLRHLCLHLMRHGAFRPLWLCDVAAALEAAPPGFDWAYFCRGDRRRTAWALCALGLARRLLGARLNGPAAVDRAARAPGWMCEVVLHQWGLGARGIRPTPGTDYLRRAGGVRRLVRDRWNNLNLVERFMAWGWWPPPDLPGWLVRLVALPVHALLFLRRGGCRPQTGSGAAPGPIDLHRGRVA